ncbi:hypothetical protein [Bacillus paramycoides]|uniref:hypothetical protein n=1 Tax=Bacillus paramycoides TaxID=2026194 RepID=UPI002E1A5087|nr:hypothetical protein [Bacillus paramycoides]
MTSGNFVLNILMVVLTLFLVLFAGGALLINVLEHKKTEISPPHEVTSVTPTIQVIESKGTSISVNENQKPTYQNSQVK